MLTLYKLVFILFFEIFRGENKNDFGYLKDTVCSVYVNRGIWRAITRHPHKFVKNLQNSIPCTTVIDKSHQQLLNDPTPYSDI